MLAVASCLACSLTWSHTRERLRVAPLLVHNVRYTAWVNMLQKYVHLLLHSRIMVLPTEVVANSLLNRLLQHAASTLGAPGS